MNRNILSIVALAAAPLAAVSANAAEVQIQAQNPVVELTVNEIVRSTPDVAQIGAGVTTRAATARQAVEQNAEAMDRLIARMKTLGIDRKDIQTSNFNLNPNYNYNRETGEQTFAGYNVNNNVNVKLRDLKRAGEVLDALVQAGANNIYGPNFMLEDDMEAKATARGNAFKRGRQMAEEYARMAGFSGVRLLEVSESFQSYGPMPVAENAVLVSGSKASADTPIEPGEVGTGVTITVKYEMQ
ncbi:SIMPL domain-containing protein [Altererythrobacter arenosus]|uniref:SIMPL domain-containing protein n=1 Tax=Altererythrobacter arenosus TaxID=3032592 RepID=A0ABY8FTD8_9SPHN|nr:SIMPL domain-containing protein [Altererythrobacter sp. CAU 1644]WFL77500.1 SIMPL domain-containing protein [Altererythrobacter sp. CAU 1644]